jgi:hypothetical protein
MEIREEIQRVLFEKDREIEAILRRTPVFYPPAPVNPPTNATDNFKTSDLLN